MAEKGHTVLPEELATLTQKKGSKYVAIKVDSQFDWAASLDDSTIHVSGDQVVLETPSSTDSLGVLVTDSNWCQHLCLVPEAQGSHKLSVTGTAQTVLSIIKKTKALGLAEKFGQRIESSLASLKESREAAKADQRGSEAKKQAENRRRCNISSLRNGLSGVGWDMSNELEPVFDEDVWDGTGKAPAQRADTQCASGASAAVAELQRLGSLKVKTVQPSDTACVPVAFWGMGHFNHEASQDISFKRILWQKKKHQSKKYQLTGTSSHSNEMKLIGKELWPSPPFGQQTLLGAVAPGSKKMLLFQGDVYNVELDRMGKGYDPDDPAAEPPQDQEGGEDALPTTAKGYRDKRKAAIESFGTAKKLRTFGAIAERLDRKCEVAEVEKYSEGINQRIEEQQANRQSAEEKDRETKMEILPPFFNADEPSQIYADGLASIASDESMQKEASLFSEDMVKMIKKSPNKILKMESQDALEGCKSEIVFAVLKARGKQGAPEPRDPQMFARKLGVLNCLLTLHTRAPRIKMGKCSPKHLCNALGMESDSPMLRQLHGYCYDPLPGERNLRLFNARKTICALIVWALYLSPELYLDVTQAVENELKMARSTVQTAFEYVGCRLDMKKDSGGFMRAVLKEAPKFNSKVYEMQSRGPKKKGGR